MAWEPFATLPRTGETFLLRAKDSQGRTQHELVYWSKHERVPGWRTNSGMLLYRVWNYVDAEWLAIPD